MQDILEVCIGMVLGTLVSSRVLTQMLLVVTQPRVEIHYEVVYVQVQQTDTDTIKYLNE